MAKYTIQSTEQTGKSPLETALINLRGELEDQFPKTTFIYGINQDNERLYLYWLDGPEIHSVRRFTGKYAKDDFCNSSETIKQIPKKVSGKFMHTFGSAKDIQYDRKVSDKFMLSQIQELAKPPAPTQSTGNTVQVYENSEDFKAGNVLHSEPISLDEPICTTSLNNKAAKATLFEKQFRENAKPPVPTHLTGNEEAEALEFKENARKTGEAKAKMQKTIKTLLDNGFTYPQLKEMHYTRLLTEYNAIEARKKFFVV